MAIRDAEFKSALLHSEIADKRERARGLVAADLTAQAT
jgi:hypothetical protein